MWPQLTDTKLHALYAAPMTNDGYPKILFWPFVATKYVNTIIKVRISSTPNLSQAASDAE